MSTKEGYIGSDRNAYGCKCQDIFWLQPSKDGVSVCVDCVCMWESIYRGFYLSALFLSGFNTKALF